MSGVLKSQRSESPVEFLRQLRELEILMIRVCDKKAKKHQKFLDQALVIPSANAYSSAKSANAIYIEDIESYELRRKLFLATMSHLQGVSAQLDVFYDLYKSDGFSQSEFESLVAYATDCRRMIKAVIASDKAKAKKLKIIG